MGRGLKILAIGGLIIWIAVFFANLCYGSELDTDTDTALLLARTCVAEIGFEGSVDECMIMWSVNQRNAIKHSRSLRRQTKLFNSYWKSPSQRRRRPWIKHLRGVARPKYWPETMGWSMFVDSWISFETAAMLFVKNPLRAGGECSDAIDYGAPGEVPNMKRVERVKCLGGRTRQHYWRLRK